MEREAQTFLEALYPQGVPADTRLLIWTLPDKASHWCASIEEAARIAEQCVNARLHVYIGALDKIGRRSNQRSTNATALGIPGLWLDIDYQDGDAHKKKNLPTQQESQALLKQIADTFVPPSLVVHSGHGYQAWWLFEQTWRFAIAADRELAGGLQRDWVYALRDIARAHGWDIDSTIDLARVMRVAGTVNFKGEPVPVTITSNLKRLPRYSPAQLRAVLESTPVLASAPASAGVPPSAAPKRKPPESQPDATVGRLTLSPDAQPPFDKWAALQDADPRVGRTWKRLRKDFADTSASSYDMSLASFAVLADWSDQEIVDLLIASRRYHQDDLKLREDYYERTLLRARSTLEPQTLDAASGDGAPPVVSPLDAIQAAVESPDPDVAVNALSKLFGVQIERLIKYVADPPKYVLELRLNGEVRAITLGGVEAVITQRTFRNAIAAAINLIIPSCAAAQWEKRAQALLNALEEQELGPESTPAGAAREWVNAYLAANRPSEDWEAAVGAGRPYAHDGYTCISLQGLGLYLRNVQGEHVTSRELARSLRMAGYEQYAQWIGGENPTTKSVWRQKQ